MPTSPSISRRGAMRAGAGALAAIGVLVIAGGARAADKLSKADVHYVDRGTEKGKDCDDCLYWIPGKSRGGPGACRLVEGEISPHGHCAAFTLASK